MKIKIIVIAAVAENGVIGRKGEIPWYIPEDLQHFKEETVGHTVVMGRRTFESLPDGFTPLPKRENIVLTRSGFSPQDGSVKIADSLEEGWEKASNDKVFIIGGSGVYEQTIEKADRMILTEIHESYDGDTFFPDYPEENWEEVKRKEKNGFDFVEYQRKL